MEISENEMILAFLQAEVRSPRFAKRLAKLDPALLYRPNIKDSAENIARAKFLNKSRGYSDRKLLFENFPTDIVWHRKSISIETLAKALFINHPDLNAASKNSRKVKLAAKNISKIFVRGFTDNVLDVAKSAQQGMLFPEIICAEYKKNLYLIEGHTRATAFVWLGRPKRLSIIVGKSKHLGLWTKQVI